MPQGIKGWSMIDRLMDKVYKNETTGCWEWTAAKNNIGYGMFRVNEQRGMMTAHKVMYQLHNKVTVPKGNVVMHTCSCYSCINPDHLVMATRQEVSNLMKSKNRQQFFGDRKISYKHCHHCGIFTTVAMLARWHDDKCKKKPKA